MIKHYIVKMVTRFLHLYGNQKFTIQNSTETGDRSTHKFAFLLKKELNRRPYSVL